MIWLARFKRLFRPRAPQSYKPVILVTGCGSGIGLALSDLLQKQTYYRVVLTSRKGSQKMLIERFKGGDDRLWIRALDITSAPERKALIDEITKTWGGVDILINNAGISYRAVVEHMDEESELHQMNTNYLGPVALIRLVMGHMREQGRGKIINVSSVSGMLAMPTMASYSASKHALEGMSEALWYEGRPLGINVSLIQPGFIRSRSFKNVYYTKQSKPGQHGPYADYYENMAPFVARLMQSSRTDSKSVAKLILKVIQTENPPLWIPATLDAIVFYYLRRLVPRRLLHPLLFFALPRSRHWGKKYSRRRNLSKVRKN
jgi:NAD(P)-dependent dehydrogenase (short-subunit alcohol dehydrogenase family)